VWGVCFQACYRSLSAGTPHAPFRLPFVAQAQGQEPWRLLPRVAITNRWGLRWRAKPQRCGSALALASLQSPMSKGLRWPCATQKQTQVARHPAALSLGRRRGKSLGDCSRGSQSPTVGVYAGALNPNGAALPLRLPCFWAFGSLAPKKRLSQVSRDQRWGAELSTPAPLFHRLAHSTSID